MEPNHAPDTTGTIAPRLSPAPSRTLVPSRTSPTQGKLLDQLRTALRTRHYSRRTEDVYALWVKRYCRFHRMRHPREMSEEYVNAYLSHLAVSEHVSASTQNQALSALLFLYRYVLDQPLGELHVVRAKHSAKLPVVLTQGEVKALMHRLDNHMRLIAGLLYGSGLHLMECLQLRVQDLDFVRKEIHIRGAKGDKERIVMLPAPLEYALREHLKKVREIHASDLAAGWGRVVMPACRQTGPMRLSGNTRARPGSGVGNGCFHKRTVGRTVRRANIGVTTCTSRSFNVR